MFSVQNAIIVICEYMFWVHGIHTYTLFIYTPGLYLLFPNIVSFIGKIQCDYIRGFYVYCKSSL